MRGCALSDLSRGGTAGLLPRPVGDHSSSSQLRLAPAPVPVVYVVYSRGCKQVHLSEQPLWSLAHVTVVSPLDLTFWAAPLPCSPLLLLDLCSHLGVSTWW